MSAHTPGPWEDISDRRRKIRGDTDRMALVSTHSGRQAIDCTGSGKDYAQDCANAKLIAAAPDLLAACKAVASLFEDVEDKPLYARKAIAAVKKATS